MTVKKYVLDLLILVAESSSTSGRKALRQSAIEVCLHEQDPTIRDTATKVLMMLPSSQFERSSEPDIDYNNSLSPTFGARQFSLICIYLGIASKNVLFRDDLFGFSNETLQSRKDWLQNMHLSCKGTDGVKDIETDPLYLFLGSKRNMLQWAFSCSVAYCLRNRLRTPLGSSTQVTCSDIYTPLYDSYLT